MSAESVKRELNLNRRTWFWTSLACGFAAHPIAALGRYLWFSDGRPSNDYWGPPVYDWQMAFVSPLLPGFLLVAFLLKRFPEFRVFQGALARGRVLGVLTILTIPAVFLGWDLTVNTAFPGGSIDPTSDWTVLERGLFYAFGLSVSTIALLIWMSVGGILGHLLGKKVLNLKGQQPRQRSRIIAEDLALIVYAIVLSIWSGNITVSENNAWLAGAFPIIGWVLTLVWFDMWQSGFALLAALWMVSVVVLMVARRLRGRTDSASEC